MRVKYIGSQLVLSLLFSVGIAWADSEEINYLEKIFQINPNEINYENLEAHFPEVYKNWDTSFESWDGNAKSKFANSVDHKKLKFKRNSEDWTFHVIKMKDDKLILNLLIDGVKEASPCKKYYSQAEKIYGKEVLSYFDSTKIVDTLSFLNTEASFEFANSRIRFSCFGMVGGLSEDKMTYVFLSGSKDVIQQTLPRTLIHCKEQYRSWDVDITVKNTRIMEEHTYSIDHDDKKLRVHNKSRRSWKKVLEFSDNNIKVQTKVKTNQTITEELTLTMTIDRLTGSYKEQRISSSNEAKKLFGKDATLTISGQCEKIEEKKKF
jgi:hypothetical protein